MRLRYTPRALVELEEVLTYVAERSPVGARRVQARIRAAADLLMRHPHSGRHTSLRSIRRMAATPYPYLIYYEPTEDEIIIIGIRHAARGPETMPDVTIT